MIREFRWNPLKSARLKKTRGASFEEIIESKLLGVKQHPIRPHQNIMFFEHKGYVWVVPYVMHGDEIFLKTLYPSRKHTRLYRKGYPP